MSAPCWLAYAAALLAVWFAWGAHREAKRAQDAAARAEAAREEALGGRHRDV